MMSIDSLLALLSLIFYAVGNLNEPPSPCDGCVSHSWNCARECDQNEVIGLSYVFDGTYKHEPDSCHEFIPYDGNSVQTDVDLYCVFPEAEWCRDFFCTQSFIACDNMNQLTLLGLSRLSECQGSALAAKLMTEECNWVCKHRRPVMRCTLHFDPSDHYGLSTQLQSCWIKETCAQAGQETLVDVTCQPENVDVGVIIETSGTLTLLADDATAVLQSPDATSALQEGIASSLPGVTAQMVKIDGIDASRRLASSPARFLSSQTLSISYTITAASDAASAITNTLSEGNTTAMTLSIGAAFQSAGISVGSVTVSDISTPTSVVKDSSELRSSNAELAALKSIVTIVDQHLQEAMEELNATLETLHNATLTQNLTNEQLDSLNAMHAAARMRLENLIDASSQIRGQLTNTSVWHNSTISQLAEAQAAATIAESRYQQTLAALASSQAALSAAHAKTNATRDQLNEALAAHNLTRAQLANLSSSNSAVVGQLEALNQNYSNALQDLSQIISLHLQVSQSLQLVEQDKDSSLQQLTDARNANQVSLDNLQAAVNQQTTIDANLSQVTASLTSVREELWTLTDNYNSATSALKNTRMSLADALKELREAQSQWALEREKLRNASNELDQEREEHDKTKQSLQESLDNEESADTKSTIFLIVSGALLFVVFMLALMLCMIWRNRKRLSLWCLRCNIQSADSESTERDHNVVVGRPVGTSTAHSGAPPAKNNGETAKGVPTSIPASGINIENFTGIDEVEVSSLDYVPPSLPSGSNATHGEFVHSTSASNLQPSEQTPRPSGAQTPPPREPHSPRPNPISLTL